MPTIELLLNEIWLIDSGWTLMPADDGGVLMAKYSTDQGLEVVHGETIADVVREVWLRYYGDKAESKS